MPTVTRVLETCLYVGDLGRAIDFYTGLFGFPIMNRDERFCALNVAPASVLLLFKQDGSLTPNDTGHGLIPPHGGHGELHVAFAIEAEDLAAWERQLAVRSIPLESTVRWPRGSVSLYFRDADNHLVELATPHLWENY